MNAEDALQFWREEYNKKPACCHGATVCVCVCVCVYVYVCVSNQNIAGLIPAKYGHTRLSSLGGFQQPNVYV